MDYEQKNPVPLPKYGKTQEIQSTMQTVFDWEYALEEKKLLGLYEKGKKLAWNASDLDWNIDVDVQALTEVTSIETFMNDVLKTPRRLTHEEAVELRVNMNAFMLSQFLHGEQGALVASAKIVQTVPWEEAKFYAANQVSDEARHVEVYHRYLTEKLGVSYEVHPSLAALLKDIVEDSRWDVTYLGMQIMVEGLALAAFGTMKMVMQNEPLLQDITSRIMADEARHVGFGVMSLQKLYGGEFSSTEMKEREQFVIEAAHLLRDRLLSTQVFERLGWDPKVWEPWMRENPFQKGFRQLMFAKIVPNLKRLGLLTPDVRRAFEQLDILRFEHEKDSVEEPEAEPPAEMVRMMMEFMQNHAQRTGPAA